MKALEVIAASLMLALLPGSAAQAAPSLAPTGKWIVDFADNMCVLQREYGSAAKPLTLSFRPTPTGGFLLIYVFDAPTTAKGKIAPARVVFEPGVGELETSLTSFSMRREAFRFNETSISDKVIPKVRAASSLSITSPHILDIGFALPGFGNAMAVLDECVIDLIDSWGFSRAQQQSLANWPQPIAPLSSYISDNDYPDRAIKEESSGANSARFTVDRQGMPGKCVIVESSGSATLDEALCTVTKRFRYKPALDKTGTPIDSISFARLRWVLPS